MATMPRACKHMRTCPDLLQLQLGVCTAQATRWKVIFTVETACRCCRALPALQFKTEPKSGEVVGLFGVFDGEH